MNLHINARMLRQYLVDSQQHCCSHITVIASEGGRVHAGSEAGYGDHVCVRALANAFEVSFNSLNVSVDVKDFDIMCVQTRMLRNCSVDCVRQPW